MLSTLDEVKACVNLERSKLFENLDKKGIIWCYITHDHWIDISRYLKYLRYEMYHRNNNKWLYHRIMESVYCRRKNKLGNRLGFYIGCQVFSEGLVIYHHGNIIVNGTARVGKNCRLHGDNCIGNNGKTPDSPIIGDNVDIGVGAKIIGGISIANNIKIAAGAVVVNSFYKEGITIGGVPAKRIR